MAGFAWRTSPTKSAPGARVLTTHSTNPSNQIVKTLFISLEMRKLKEWEVHRFAPTKVALSAFAHPSFTDCCNLAGNFYVRAAAPSGAPANRLSFIYGSGMDASLYGVYFTCAYSAFVSEALEFFCLSITPGRLDLACGQAETPCRHLKKRRAWVKIQDHQVSGVRYRRLHVS